MSVLFFLVSVYVCVKIFGLYSVYFFVCNIFVERNVSFGKSFVRVFVDVFKYVCIVFCF